MLVLCSVIPGAPDGVLSTDAIIGTDTLGSILPRWTSRMDCIPSAASQGRHIVRPRFYCGALFHSTVFRGGSTLYHTYCGWPVNDIQRPFGGSDNFCGKPGFGRRPDAGGPVGMEGSSAGI